MNMNKRCMILDYRGRSQKNVPSNLVTASQVRDEICTVGGDFKWEYANSNQQFFSH